MAVGQYCEGRAPRTSGTDLTYYLASCGFGLRRASTCSTAGKSSCPSISFGRNTSALADSMAVSTISRLWQDIPTSTV